MASTAYPNTLDLPSLRVQFVDSNGVLTTHGHQLLSDYVNYIRGSCRVIPCNATGTNVITLTMLSVAPLLTHYNDYDTFRFTAANTTTGLVTALVVAPQLNGNSATFSTLKVLKSNGSAQATTGDITANLLYDLVYVDALDSGNGAFVLK